MRDIPYTGIGSRETPPEICTLMTALATELEKRGMILRSGHANGADIAFEKGVINPVNKEIYLPWRGFNGSDSRLFHTSQQAYDLAAQFHPAWNRCSRAAKLLHARNGPQVFGQALNRPSAFVICWTRDGKDSGGTGQALRLARHYEVPIHNLHDPVELERANRFLNP